MTDQETIQAALSANTDEIILQCLTIEHPSLGEPIRLVDDWQDLTRSAGVFTAFPFEFQDIVRGDDRVAEAMITADNVDQRIIESLRGVVGRPTVTYEVVRRSAPNVVQYGPSQFEFIGFQAALGTVAIRIAFALPALNEAFPKDVFSPSNAG